ncbi:MAG: hypothetical protein GF383_04215 [Candidatus Lokiarchaeota archaeon]|nr:hypothetical protein [Candidatus Lokiarchaeota archaeon]MBD3338959.1 hypothetical protein [Candidatus Lokiarchaeota archaeon]
MVKQAHYNISSKVKKLDDPQLNKHIKWIKSQIPEGRSDFAIAIGGDGEVLNAFHKYPQHKILGMKIEDGRSLGFFSAVNLNEVDEKVIQDIKNDKYTSLSLPLLACEVGKRRIPILNDVAIIRRPNGKSGKFEVDVGGDIFQASGDGVIISTPGGSSSYNFASGGSIISWNLYAYSVRFFNLTRGLRSVSLIVPGDTITKVTNLYDAFIEIDGAGFEINPETQVITHLTEKHAKIISFEYHAQLQRLKRMLRSTKID